MLNYVKRIMFVAAVVVVLSGCDQITPFQYEAGSGVKFVQVASGNGSECPVPTRPQKQTLVVRIAGGGRARATSFGPNGEWGPLNIAAPTKVGSHKVTTTCNGIDVSSPFDVVTVDPKFSARAIPASYSATSVPAEVTISGTWCVSPVDPPFTLSPLVSVDLNGTTLDVFANSNQPFKDTWQLSFDTSVLPTVPGTYNADVTCTTLGVLKITQVPITVT
ncbi:MAG: hypothetical protein QOC92_3164 [Acidimicrobiaceae bacterium]